MRYLIVSLLLLIASPCDAAIQGCRNFDDANDEVDWGVVNDTTTGNRIVCAWVKMTSDAAGDIILGKKSNTLTSTAGYMMQQDSGGVVGWYISDATDFVTSTGTTNIDSAWHHVCGQWIASGENTNLFVDGIQEDADTGGGAIDSLTNAFEFAAGEDGGENGDANGVMCMFSTAGQSRADWEIMETRFQVEGMGATSTGATIMIVPGWTGATENDIYNSIDGIVSNSAALTDGPPIMQGWGYSA